MDRNIEIVAGQHGLDKIISILDLSAEDAERRIQGWLEDS